jgi:hypothetical protein
LHTRLQCERQDRSRQSIRTHTSTHKLTSERVYSPLGDDGPDEGVVSNAAVLTAEVIKDHLCLAVRQLDIEDVEQLVELCEREGEGVRERA